MCCWSCRWEYFAHDKGLRGQNTSYVLGVPRQVSNIVSDALFILLVEKDAAFMRLAEDRFYNTYPLHHPHRQGPARRRLTVCAINLPCCPSASRQS